MSGADWEKSKALTPLKRDILKSFFGYSKDFFLTGGSALGIFYLEHRKSYDLDLFTLKPVDWHLVETTIRAVAQDINARIDKLTASPFFMRFEVSRDNDRELVDFVKEMAPQVYTDKSVYDGIVVDPIEEIVINKWCSLLGRLEIKDLIDLYFLKNKCDIWNLFGKAHLKEGGLDPSILSYIVSQLKVSEIPAIMLTAIRPDDLKDFIAEIQTFLDTQAFPE
jgi:hypothetical protein